MKLIFCPLRSDIPAWGTILQNLQMASGYEPENLDLEVGYNGRMIAIMRVKRWEEAHTRIIADLAEANLIDANYELGE